MVRLKRRRFVARLPALSLSLFYKVFDSIPDWSGRLHSNAKVGIVCNKQTKTFIINLHYFVQFVFVIFKETLLSSGVNRYCSDRFVYRECYSDGNPKSDDYTTYHDGFTRFERPSFIWGRLSGRRFDAFWVMRQLMQLQKQQALLQGQAIQNSRENVRFLKKTTITSATLLRMTDCFMNLPIKLVGPIIHVYFRHLFIIFYITPVGLYFYITLGSPDIG